MNHPVDSVSNLIKALVTPRQLQEAGIDAESLDCPDSWSALEAVGALSRFQLEAIQQGDIARLAIGRYDILDRLGAGGMGTVFKARHREMKRLVAIKVLHRSPSDSLHLIHRFQRETETIARLQHPNVVMAFDAGQTENGPYLVMEYVEGADLASLKQRGALSQGQILRAIRDAARGLAYAHEQGIVHRDVKPANLLRDVHGVVKVADLGLAQLQDEGESPGQDLTRPGSFLGTVTYMSPEQAFRPDTVSAASDIYSLGVTLFALLAGKPPYEGESQLATLLLHRESPIPDLAERCSGLSPGVSQLVTRMLAKSPADRPASMAQVARELEVLVLQLQDESGEKNNSNLGETGTRDEKPEFTLVAPSSLPIGLCVAIVEPSRTQAAITRLALEQAGISVSGVFRSATALLESLAGQPMDIILTAMHLDDMSAVSLSEALDREYSQPSRPNRPALVIVTSDDESAGSGLASLRNFRLSKPFTSEQLLSTLAKAAIPSTRTSGPRQRDKVPREQWRVLIVDDSLVCRLHAQNTLRQLGITRFVDVPDAADAVARLSGEHFDLVVTDYHMKFMDGDALVGYLRANPATAQVPVVMVTSETSPARLDAIRRLDVAGIVDKSFPIEIVASILDRLES